jgi:hypothetical protein
MNDLRDESRALRRDLLVVVCTFATSFVAAFAVGLYVLLRYAIPERGWWAIGDAFQLLLQYPIVISLCSSLAVHSVTEWLQRREPMERRWPLLERPRQTRSRWRHYCRQFPLALKIFLFVLLIVIVLCHYAVKNRDPYLLRVFVFQFLLCLLFAIVSELLIDLASWFTRVRRIRLRMTIVTHMLSAWVLMSLSVMALLKLTMGH